MTGAIIGYGKSGVAARNLLKIKGFEQVDVFDDNTALDCNLIRDFKGDYDMVVVSPGINLKKYPNVPKEVTSEIELAYGFMGEGCKIVAVTGTNGKSTTTHLTAQILNNAGVKAVACGNIGTPFAEAVLDKSIQVFVIELSSFQIDLLRDFNADVACIINITPDHLDRYGSLDAYYKSKLRLLNFIDEAGVFVSSNDKRITTKTRLHRFNTVEIDESFPKCKNNILDFGGFHVKLSKFHLFGNHNIINLSFALCLASSIKEFKGDVTELISNLTSMPHRTELVGVYGGVTWINDSKGTNVDSVLTALKSIKKPSFLLLGGRDKRSDYTVLKDLINENVSTVCYFGEAALLIKNQLSELVQCKQEVFASLADSVKYCAANAKLGATVILSPACTSFDEFANYEERGKMFHSYVLKYGGIKG